MLIVFERLDRVISSGCVISLFLCGYSNLPKKKLYDLCNMFYKIGILYEFLLRW